MVVASRDLLESSSEVACEVCDSSTSGTTFSFAAVRFLFVTREIPGVTAGVFGSTLVLSTRGVSGTPSCLL